MIDVDWVRTAHPLATVVEQSGVTLRPAGRRLVGRCPFHPDRTPSFTVYPETQRYFCFGCGAGGDVIDFITRRDRLDFLGAIARLGVIDVPGQSRGGAAADRRELPAWRHGRRSNASGSPATENRARRDPVALAVVDAAARFYHEQLRCNGAARDYLARRGITLGTAIRERLGYAPGCGLAHHLRGRGFDLGIAEAIGLLRGGRETLAGRLVIPNVEYGHATWLTGRAIGAANLRYMSLRLPVPLLGRALVASEEVTLTEGPFDWLIARQWGLPALALLGTHVSATVVDLLRRYCRVYLMLDTDPAGRRATRQLQNALGDAAVPVPLPPGVTDLNELACQRDGQAMMLAALRTAGFGQTHTPTARVEPADDRCAASAGRLA